MAQQVCCRWNMRSHFAQRIATRQDAVYIECVGADLRWQLKVVGKRMALQRALSWRLVAARCRGRSARFQGGVVGMGVHMLGALHQRLDIISHLWTLVNFCSVCRPLDALLVLVVVHRVQLVQDLLCGGLMKPVLHHGARVNPLLVNCSMTFAH